ncbi:MAG TPA: SOS response-associated peptidase [Acidimicrobiales bacterium]|nr:SOS response-associated peptidase [Acidimicrobiales bacterium]
MCGRYVLVSPTEDLVRFFDAREAPGLTGRYEPSYNVAPTRQVLGVALSRRGDRVLDTYRWGLVPSWAKDPSIGNRLFNARGESVASKPAFGSAFKHRRIVVPSDGFYEWQKAPGGARRPFYFTRADGEPLAFAGLWEPWRDPARRDDPDAWIRTCTIITTGAGEDVVAFHDRMPVVLDRAAIDRWLDPDDAERDGLEGLLRPAPAGTLVVRAVDPRVGDARNDTAELLAGPPR